MSEQRRLAAILAADVVGYSKLVGSDETGTLARLAVLRNEVIEPTIALHAGRLFKAMGDGFLIEFASAVQAVKAARAIQEVNAIGTLPLRIGIHVGDVVVEGNDLMGDGVNIAARIEGVAEAGGIAISRAVHEQVRDKLDVSFVDKGEVALKNLARPVQVFALGGVTSSSATEPAPALALPDKPSVAVLPFQNMSGDPEQEYFADGMVEDIITALSRTKALFVIARNSTFSYKGKSPDIRQVGRELGVRYVLEGSVRLSGSRLRVTGQLIDAAIGTHVWADRFDGAMSDMFDLQDTITSRVIAEIIPSLERAEIERAQRKTLNLQAYDLYLRAMAGVHQQTHEGVSNALALLDKAIVMEPTLAVAHSAKASCHFSRQAFSWTDDPAREATQAERSIGQAFQLDGNDPRILTVYGQILTHTAGRISEGVAHLDHALELDTNNALALMWRGLAKIDVGDSESAVADLRQVMRLSPRDPYIWIAQHGMGKVHFFRGDHAEALRWETEALRLRPNFVNAHRVRIAAHALAGDHDRARRLFDDYRSLDPGARLSTVRAWYARSLDADIDKLVEGLRLAGMAE